MAERRQWPNDIPEKNKLHQQEGTQRRRRRPVHTGKEDNGVAVVCSGEHDHGKAVYAGDDDVDSCDDNS